MPRKNAITACKGIPKQSKAGTHGMSHMGAGFVCMNGDLRSLLLHPAQRAKDTQRYNKTPACKREKKGGDPIDVRGAKQQPM